MLENIQDYENYCDIPFDQRCTLVQEIGNLLLNDNKDKHNLCDVLEHLNSIRSEFKALNQLCAMDGSLNLKKSCENM